MGMQLRYCLLRSPLCVKLRRSVASMPQRKIHVGSPLAAKVLRFNARVAVVLRRLGRKHDARKKIVSNYISVLFFLFNYMYIYFQNYPLDT